MASWLRNCAGYQQTKGHQLGGRGDNLDLQDGAWPGLASAEGVRSGSILTRF